MTKALGYNATFDGTKCLSISTGVQPDGTYEFYINALGGPGVERHVHGYASVSSQGLLAWGGARVKDNVADHLGEGLLLSHTTQEIARLIVERTPKGPRCQFKQNLAGEWLESTPSMTGGRIARAQFPLPNPASPRCEYSISMFDARVGVPANSTNCVAVAFSAPLPFGIAFTRIPSTGAA